MTEQSIYTQETLLIERVNDYIKEYDFRKNAIFQNSLRHSIYQFTQICMAKKGWSVCLPSRPCNVGPARSLLYVASGVYATRDFGKRRSVISRIIEEFGEQMALAAGWLILVGCLNSYQTYYPNASRAYYYELYLMGYMQMIISSTATGIRTHFQEPIKTLEQLEEGDYGTYKWHNQILLLSF